MNKISIQKFYKFGAHVRYLNSAPPGQPLYGELFVISNIEVVLKYIDDLNLPVSRGASEDLRRLRKKFKALPEGSKLTNEQAMELQNTIKVFRKTLDSEITLKTAYVVSQKRVDTDRLLGDVPSLLAPGVFSLLSRHALVRFFGGREMHCF